MERMRWYEGGGQDALDHAVDVGPENQYEPDQEPDPRRCMIRKAIAGHMEFSAQDPATIVEECEEQDRMLGLPRGSSLELFLASLK